MKAIGCLFVLSATAWQIGIHFAHPDMTETRILLTFWWQQVAQLALLLVGGWLIRAADAREEARREHERAVRRRAMRGGSGRY